MPDEILFERGTKLKESMYRGKHKDTGNWVEGYLSETTFYSVYDKFVSFVVCKKVRGVTIYYDLDPNTIGRYTEYTDQQGVKIFEGDIVAKTIGRATTYYTVSWNVDHWIIISNCEGVYDLNRATAKNIVVVGNIYDNSEL